MELNDEKTSNLSINIVGNSRLSEHFVEVMMKAHACTHICVMNASTARKFADVLVTTANQVDVRNQQLLGGAVQ